ncbi:MAG: serpin family protein [Paludibacteraceae bacterium]|nr:serpin family protein [Paludibacteraceae bacterium]
MKKSTILLLCAATILFSACNQNAPVNKQREVKKLVLSPQDEAINVHQNEFTLNLLKQANANETESENVFLSPLSVSILCGMLTNGASGNTLDQILSTIGAGDFSVDDLNNYYQNILENLPYLDKTTDMKIADAIWVDDQCHAKKDFIGINKMYYLADVVNLDLQDQLAPKAINDWANKNTKGLIKEVINEPFSDDARMVLTNAIYFKGNWQVEFKKSATRDEDFTTTEGKTVTVSMMNMNEKVMVTRAPAWICSTEGGLESYGARMLRLYFKDKAYCMDIILPREGVSCDEYLAMLNMQALQLLETALGEYDIEVKLPKFTLKYHRDLNEDMKTLGMTDAFSGQLANFSGIAEEPLYLSKLFQDSFLEVDEAGAKAAAVTVATMDYTSAEPDVVPPFIVNRPFLLFIRECTYGTILFAGKIGHPESK